MSKSNIEWTDMVWNPVTGCTKVSAGCKNCYAETWAGRKMGEWKDRKFSEVKFYEDRLSIPSKRKKPTRFFVNSMSDLFHKDVPFDFIDKVFDVMYQNPQHTFMILTKRPNRMYEYISQRAYEKSFGFSPEERKPFSQNSIHHMDDISMRNECGYICNSLTNNGYGCNHPNQKDREILQDDDLKMHKERELSSILDKENSEGRCFCHSCPIAYEIQDKKTLKEHGLANQYEFDKEGYTSDTEWMKFYERPKNAAVENVWLGVSVENQEEYDKRIHALADIKRNLGRYFKIFLSIEPLLSSINFKTTEEPKEYYDDYPEERGNYSDAPRDWSPLDNYDYSKGFGETKYIKPLLDWVIVGGESGHNARPVHPDWVRSIRDQCQAAKVKFFFKQWREYFPVTDLEEHFKDRIISFKNRWRYDLHNHYKIDEYGDICKAHLADTPRDYFDANSGYDQLVVKLGKEKSGRLLDGREWNEMP